MVIGPGACLGAGGVLAGVAAPAGVVASTPMRTLRLPADVYASFLRELPDVELELQRLATRRVRDVAGALEPDRVEHRRDAGRPARRRCRRARPRAAQPRLDGGATS